MQTVPQILLAGVLMAGGVATGAYLINLPKPPPDPPPPPKPFTCQMGQLLIYPNCYPVLEGNIDFRLNTGNKFSTSNSECAHLIVVTGTIRINDASGPNVSFHQAGEGTDICRDQIVTATSDNTLLQKRSW